jgi:hypothetical protein
MFEELFGKAAFIVVYKIAPYAVERQQFLEHCREQGFTKTCLQRMAGILLAAAIDLQGHGGLDADQARLEVDEGGRRHDGGRSDRPSPNEFRFFANNGYTLLATSVPVVVASGTN